jgi:hypothetical protein
VRESGQDAQLPATVPPRAIKINPPCGNALRESILD